MDMVLLDWTRMGSGYCLAGAVEAAGGYRVVRPLLARSRTGEVRKCGWGPFLLDGHARWEVFELVGARPTPPEPPHVEDLYVRALRPRRCSAGPVQRRAILQATCVREGDELFGAPLTLTQASAYLGACSGTRSLVTVRVETRCVSFHASQRVGVSEADFRVALCLPGIGERHFPVKDHHLLCHATRAAADLAGQARALNQAVRQMGEVVAVRLGLSRAFQTEAGRAPLGCWLMADGFFSWSDPQP